MTRAQTLGLMAATLAAENVQSITVSSSEGGRQNGVYVSPDIASYVQLADALLREAERVSPADARCNHEWAGFGLGPDPKLVCNKCGEVAAAA